MCWLMSAVVRLGGSDGSQANELSSRPSRLCPHALIDARGLCVCGVRCAVCGAVRSLLLAD